jgi:hypothetical protein
MLFHRGRIQAIRKEGNLKGNACFLFNSMALTNEALSLTRMEKGLSLVVIFTNKNLSHS